MADFSREVNGKKYDFVFNPKLNGASIIHLLSGKDCNYIAAVEGSTHLWYILWPDGTKTVETKVLFSSMFS